MGQRYQHNPQHQHHKELFNMTKNGRVSLRDVYDVVNDLRTETNHRIELLENKVDDLQSFKSRMFGIGTVLVVVISGLSSWVWSKVTGN